MIRATFKEPITKQVFLLIGVFLAALVFIVIGQSLMHKELIALNSLRKNELAKIEMSYLIHIELQKIQSLFQNMSLCKTEYELDFFSNQIITTIKNIQNFIGVIGDGGTATYTYKVNFGNEEEIKRNFTYRNLQKSEINLDVFELTSKVNDLVKHELNFKKLILQKIDLEGKIKLPEIDQKILFFYKGVDPYFQRIFENSYRIYFTAQAEMQRLHDIANATEKQYWLRFYLACAFTALLISGLTGMVLVNIGRILKERNTIQDELKNTNENLEQTILERTWKLQDEVEERQKAQEKEHQQALFLKTIIDSLAHPFYVVDVDTYEIQMLNDYARQLNAEQTQYCFSLTHQRKLPCGGDEHPCPIMEVKNSGQPVTMEHTHYDHAGNKIYVEVHGYPIFDEEGRICQMIEYSLDITRKKMAEIALEETNRNLETIIHERTLNLEEEIGRRQEMQVKLQESEHYYRTLIESSNDLIIIIDATGHVTYVSPSSQNILGYPAESLEGKSLYDYLHPHDIRFGKEQFSIFLASLEHGQRLEHRVLAADGQYRVLESSFRNLFADNTIHGLLLTARDITEKRKADALMRKLQLVIEQSPNSVVITNKDGIIEYVNPQFELVTGYSRSEVLGENPKILNSGLTPQETYNEMWSAITNAQVWQGEFVNRNKKGDIYYENVVIAPLKNEYGETTHYVAMKENITELIKARQQADASNKAKSQFLSRMSHELRTPLNAINGFSMLLMGSKTHPLSPRQLQQVSQINTAGHHLLELINEILDLSRIESGRMSLSIEPISLMDGLQTCLPLVESLASHNNITIHIDDSAMSLPLIRADLTRFKQVLLNLLSNAIKYNRPGGTVTITAADEKGMGCIRVIDTGIGIPKEKQREIFVPFSRLGQDHTAIEGTGIGMTISKQLVELMQGTIDLESIPDEGTTFQICLPLADQGAEKKHTPPQMTVHAGTAPTAATILYIDDNAAGIAVMREVMAQWPHYSLVVRKTAKKGIQAVTILNPDLIIMDINMPDMSGIEAFTVLQQNSATRNIPVIALSADTLPDTAERCRELGFYDYFVKPVDAQVLQAVLAAALHQINHETTRSINDDLA
ncbi:MAG: PAS domain S-box protein [Pseudomonadota bacterium]